MKNEMLQMIRETKSDQELDKLISNKIGYENFFNTKGETLGIDTDLNPKRSIYDGSDDDLYDDSILEWDGYIPFGTKIVYNTWYYNQENLSFNGGGYGTSDNETGGGYESSGAGGGATDVRLVSGDWFNSEQVW